MNYTFFTDRTAVDGFKTHYCTSIFLSDVRGFSGPGEFHLNVFFLQLDEAVSVRFFFIIIFECCLFTPEA